MTNTNLQTTDQLTPNVYNDFTLSPYAMWTATNVNLIEFPKRTTLYVITVKPKQFVGHQTIILHTEWQAIANT